MKRFLISFLCGGFFLLGCSTYSEIKSPRYFNTDVDILDYTANFYGTEWTLRAKPGETMRVVFNYEIIDIDFKPDPERPGEYIFILKSEVHGQ